MKRYFILGVLIQFLSITSVFAGDSQHVGNDICSQLPGQWKGAYTVKDQKDCKQDNSCTHQFELSAVHVSGSDYQVALKPQSQSGAGKVFNVKCENGVIASSYPNSQVSASCNELNRCLVSYSDANVTSEIVKG